MAQHQRIADPVSASFGEDRPPVTYDHIAAQIRALQPRALTSSQFDDVILMLEWMRDETVKLLGANDQASKALAEREREVSKRERDVGIRQRVHAAATRTRGVLRYFRR